MANATSSAVEQASGDFTALNSHVFVAPPLSETSEDDGPSMILFFGWFDAKMCNVRKYTDTLRHMHPSAKLILITSEFNVYWRSRASREQLFRPVVDLLENARNNEKASRGLLIYVISNGGAFQFLALSQILDRHSPSPSPNRHPSFKSTALILDSTPGDKPITSAIDVFGAPFRNNPIAKALAVPPILLVLGIFSVVYWLNGNPPIFPDLRERLTMPGRMLPGIVAPCATIPRLYLFSKEDVVVRFEFVQAHADEARSRGYDVRTVVFERSAHASHAKEEPERYWGAVAQIWRDAVRAKL
ncbi:Transmembrane protein 53-B [Grifola frondosa]|uniref:Transmembrane protein 53-B n=1 Tax=Grifola frondosa TaxID=5627 RepID=A0A1C7M859_GRIFR|nr:Transmembrane protein 53-B [Grifola frondosa]